MRHRLSRLAPAAFVAAGACATTSDIRILQNDLAVMRAESAQRDSAQRARIDSILVVLGLTHDSLQVVSARFAKFSGDAREELYNLGQQLIQVQELTGQSQRRLQELRGSLEQRAAEFRPDTTPRTPAVVPAPVTRPPVPTPGAPATGAPAAQPAAPDGAAAPGPNQLFQLAVDQLRRGSVGTARAGFEDLLRRYPSADVAPDAQFYIAETYATENQPAQADSAYAIVVTRYPRSPRAPTAMYRRALLMRAANRIAAARATLNDVIRLYPRSDEAELARERLGELP